MTPQVGAVVVTHSRPDLAERCVSSLRGQVPVEAIVVVLNRPDSGAEERLRNHGVRLVTNGVPRGYGENLNAGVAELGMEADLILLLNDDLELPANSVSRLAAALQSVEGAGLAAPAIIGPDGGREPSVFLFPSPASELVQFLLLPERLSARLRAPFARPASAGTRVVDWVLGATMMVRRDAFEMVGGLDRAFVMYSEETDLCLRLARRGWRTISVGDIEVVHLGGASTGDRRYARMLAVSRKLYLLRHWKVNQRLALRVGLVIGTGWNLSYTLVRVALAPRQARLRWSAFLERWNVRPLLRPFAQQRP